jgi:hypothetical protein
MNREKNSSSLQSEQIGSIDEDPQSSARRNAALENEINQFTCECKDHAFGGSCFRKNFINAQSGLTDNAKAVLLLQLYRQKVSTKNKQDIDSQALVIFRQHCTNLTEVIDPTALDSSLLFGSTQQTSQSYIDEMNQLQDFIESSNFGGTRQVLQDYLFKIQKDSALNHMNNNKKNKKHFKFDWDEEIGPNWLPDGNTKLKLCRSSICFLYGISVNKMKAISSKMKNANSLDITSSRTEREYNHRTFFNYSFNKIDSIFRENQLDASASSIRAGLVRASNPSVDALIWLENHFDQ